MAIQNPSGPRPGGTASALNVSTPAVLKWGGGTFWNINVSQIGQQPGYVCDSATIAGAGPQNAIVTLNPATFPGPDLPGAGPFPFFNGLVFIPGSDGMIASISYA